MSHMPVTSPPNDPDLGLRERSRREKYERIRQATETLLQTRPFDEVTTRDVARMAQVGEATLFRYVATKDELLLLVVDHKMEQVVSAIEEDASLRTFEADETGRDHIDRVYEIYRRRGEFYLADPQNVANYLWIALKPGSELGAHNVAQGDRIIALISEIVDHGQQTGVLFTSASPQVVAENCNGLYVHEMLRSPTRGFGPDTFTDRLLRRLRGQLEPLIRDGRT
jgi:AcrR family transcriptional regulator